MVKLDKVIKSRDKCASGTGCRGCWYSDPDVFTSGECMDALHRDSRDLLKEYRLLMERSSSGDLISRSELLKFPIRRDHYDRENGNEHFINGIETVMEYVENLPTVAAELVVHARWRWMDLNGDGCSLTLCCSNCLETRGVRETMKRCPECGAQMDEEVADG